MNAEQQIVLEYCRKLNAISLQFGESFEREKTRLLNTLPALHTSTAESFILLHDTLLTMLAWPENKALFSLAKHAMNKLIAAIKERIPNENKLDYALNGSGIAGSEITGHFSYEITRWLVNEFGISVRLHSWDAATETIKLFFRQVLPGVEYESIFSEKLSPARRINKLKGRSTLTDLQWLIMLVEESTIPDSMKELLFNELKIFITWKPDRPSFSRSGFTIPIKKIFYCRKPVSVADIKNILSLQLPPSARLPTATKKLLVNVAKATLVFLNRETDPFTFATVGDMVCFEIERGYSIALYSLKKEQRLSIESYVGYLVFKNGIPVAYGGGWIFGERCQFGINILEPFRGSESAFILSQLIRVYHQYFGVKRFVVKPYQFGLNNKEGLESGAFWFYYKYGFRPVNKPLQKLANEEFETKKDEKNYRTPLNTLKKFTKSDLQLLLDKDPVPSYDASVVSKAITDFIIRTYNGDRKKAMAGCLRKTKQLFGHNLFSSWTITEKKVLEEWSLLACANLNVSAWTGYEKKQFIQLIRSKANDSEFNFIKHLQKNRRFWKDLNGKFL